MAGEKLTTLDQLEMLAERVQTELTDVEDSASASASAASASASAAAASASAAAASASAAATSATNAASSATAADGSASDAADSATAAAGSATNASTSAQSAQQSAQSAGAAAARAEEDMEAAQAARNAAVPAANRSENGAGRAERAATNAISYSENAEAWAVGERSGEPVTSTDDTYENNAKYYSELAAASAATIENAVSALKSETVTTVVSEESLWTRGTLLSATGRESSAAFRMRTPYIDKAIRCVGVGDGYSLSVYGYTSEGTYQGIWNGTAFEKALPNPPNTDPVYISQLPQEYRYRLVVSRLDSQTINTSECSNVWFEYATDTTLTKDGIAADAAAVGAEISRIDGVLSELRALIQGLS